MSRSSSKRRWRAHAWEHMLPLFLAKAGTSSSHSIGKRMFSACFPLGLPQHPRRPKKLPPSPQEAPEIAPRRPKTSQKRLQDGPREPQRGPKRPPRRPERTPRRPQESSQRRSTNGHFEPSSPGGPQEASRSPQNAPKRPQEASNGPEDAPEGPKEAPKGPQNCPLSDPRESSEEIPRSTHEDSDPRPRHGGGMGRRQLDLLGIGTESAVFSVRARGRWLVAWSPAGVMTLARHTAI